jgi:hypothetical protein
MAPQHPLETLNIAEIRRLMQLAIEAGLRTHEFDPRLMDAFGALAAELGFALWCREQARVEVRRKCGRTVGSWMSSSSRAKSPLTLV